MDVKKYARKPFVVEGIQVTEENFEEVAKWCLGDIRTQGSPDGLSEREAKYVKVRVHRPVKDRQTMAFVGDWVLYTDTGGYRVYTPHAFEKSFELAE